MTAAPGVLPRAAGNEQGPHPLQPHVTQPTTLGPPETVSLDKAKQLTVNPGSLALPPQASSAKDRPLGLDASVPYMMLP